MAMEVRRIVTGHDANGKAVVKTDERLPAVSRLGRPHIAGCEIWSTDRMPADNSDAADAAQRKGFVTRYNYVGTGQGTVIRITEFAPGAPTFMHRTETVDYALLLSGECDLELDSGEVAHLKPGDVVVQRGTMHAWVNNGPAPCVFAFILIDANPAEVRARSCAPIFPHPDPGGRRSRAFPSCGCPGSSLFQPTQGVDVHRTSSRRWMPEPGGRGGAKGREAGRETPPLPFPAARENSG